MLVAVRSPCRRRAPSTNGPNARWARGRQCGILGARPWARLLLASADDLAAAQLCERGGMDMARTGRWPTVAMGIAFAVGVSIAEDRTKATSNCCEHEVTGIVSR